MSPEAQKTYDALRAKQKEREGYVSVLVTQTGERVLVGPPRDSEARSRWASEQTKKNIARHRKAMEMLA